MDKGVPVPTVITIFVDKSFTVSTKTPPASYLLKKAAGVSKGGSEPGRATVSTISRSKIKEIAEAKMVDLNANDIDAAMKIIEGSARSMGMEVQE